MSHSSDGDILTTFQAARLCGVSHKSIERWIDGGLLRGFRTPGGHRRVYRDALVAFMRERRAGSQQVAPIPGADPVRVLVIGASAPVRHSFETGAEASDFQVAWAATAYQTGVAMERFAPHALLLDLEAAGAEGLALCRDIRNEASHAHTIVIAAVASENVADLASRSGLVDATVVHPIGLAELRGVLGPLLSTHVSFHVARASD